MTRQVTQIGTTYITCRCQGTHSALCQSIAYGLRHYPGAKLVDDAPPGTRTIELGIPRGEACSN